MDSFPSQDQFKQGAYLYTIAHAIWIAKNPLLAYEVGWDGDVFLLNNSMGATGALHFGDPFVGVFCDAKSPRNPYRSSGDYTWKSYFKRASAFILEAAFSVPLQFMLDHYKGDVVPIITTAVWSDGEQVVSDDEQDGFAQHGGRLITPYIGNFARGLRAIAENYHFSAEQALLIHLYNRRIAKKEDIILTKSDRNALFSQGDAGKIESENLLKSIGILFS